MFRGTIEFTADAFATILAYYGIGEPHITMEPEPVWRDSTAHVVALRDAREQFGRYGFIHDDGSLDGGFRDTLNATCHAGIEYYSWFQVRGETTAVLAGTLEQESFIAVRTGTRIRMRRIPPGNVVGELISEIPALRPAQFTPISMRLSEARSALLGGRNQGGGYLQSMSGSRGSSPVATLKEFTGREEMGGGQISVAVRDGMGRRTVCEFPLRFVDNPEGRILNVITREGGGEPWLLVVPATPQAVQQRLEALRVTLPSR